MGVEATQDPAAYDVAYKAEMDRLEAEAASKNAPTSEEKTETPAPEVKTEEKTTPAAEDPETRFARLESELNSTKKALNDTKKWAQESNARAKRLEQERERERREANKPAVLTDNPGLEEAIQHVVGTKPAQQQADMDDWATKVGMALPDLDALLEQSPELRAKATAKRDELGDEWNNPMVAIRELGKLQLEHVRAGVSAQAQAQARADFEKQRQKQTAMNVPGGGSAPRPQANPADDPNRYATMSSADFAKERAKVLGYQ